MASEHKKYVCSYESCSATFSRSDRLEIHLRTHSGERPYVCTYGDCTKSYVCSSHLNRHEASHEQSSVRCSFEDCDAVFKNSTYLAKHISIYHNEEKAKTYKCKFCGAEFKRRVLLKEHSYEHSGVKPYLCPEAGCEMRFMLPSRLKRHMKVHRGYKCTYKDCDAVCSTWGLYRKHVKIFHPRTYECEVCSKTFALSYNFHMHKKTHIDPNERESFCCPFPNCPRIYTEKRNLSYHMRQYHGKRPFTCTFEDCGSSFKTEAHLKKHLKSHNPSVPVPKKKKKNKSRSFASVLAGYFGDTVATQESESQKCPSEIDSSQNERSDDSFIEGESEHESEAINAIDVELPNAQEFHPDSVNYHVVSESGDISEKSDNAGSNQSTNIPEFNLHPINYLLVESNGTSKKPNAANASESSTNDDHELKQDPAAHDVERELSDIIKKIDDSNANKSSIVDLQEFNPHPPGHHILRKSSYLSKKTGHVISNKFPVVSIQKLDLDLTDHHIERQLNDIIKKIECVSANESPAEVKGVESTDYQVITFTYTKASESEEQAIKNPKYSAN